MTSEINRRKLIAAISGAAALGLAGCAEEENANETEMNEPSRVKTRPRLPDDPRQLDQPMQFIVESLDYQNRILEDEHGS